jgi:hypothetical protein
MSKAVSISFPVKSAEELAAHLGVSKSRTRRIFAIVEKALANNGSHVKIQQKREIQGPCGSKVHGSNFTIRTAKQCENRQKHTLKPTPVF